MSELDLHIAGRDPDLDPVDAKFFNDRFSGVSLLFKNTFQSEGGVAVGLEFRGGAEVLLRHRLIEPGMMPANRRRNARSEPPFSKENPRWRVRRLRGDLLHVEREIYDALGNAHPLAAFGPGARPRVGSQAEARAHFREVLAGPRLAGSLAALVPQLSEIYLGHRLTEPYRDRILDLQRRYREELARLAAEPQIEQLSTARTLRLVKG